MSAAPVRVLIVDDDALDGIRATRDVLATSPELAPSVTRRVVDRMAAGLVAYEGGLARP